MSNQGKHVRIRGRHLMEKVKTAVRSSRAKAALGTISALALVTAVLIPVTGGFGLNQDKAEAHSGTTKVTVTCPADQYQLDFKSTLSSVPSGAKGTVYVHVGKAGFENWNWNTWNDWQVVETNIPSNQSSVTWTRYIPGTTVGNDVWVYFYGKWTDGYETKIGDTRAEGLKGNCKAPVNPKVDLTGTPVCVANGTWTVTWTVTITNSGNLSEVDLKVIKHLPAGSLINGVDAQVWLTEWIEHHANHGLPPWPTNGVVSFTQSNIPGNATSATTMVQYDFKGGPSGDPEKTITLSGDCAPPDSPTATASINTTPASCTASGSATVTGLSHATLVGTLDQTPGTHEATFKADDKYTFPGGSKTLTVTYTIPAKNTGIECEPQLPTAATLTSSYVCGALYNTGELVGARGANVAYLIDGQRISQANVPYAPFNLEALLDGHGVDITYGQPYTVTTVVADVDTQWPSQQNADGDVVLGTFQLTLIDPFECPVTFTPVVTVVDGTCNVEGTVSGVPSPNVTWGEPYGDVTATYIDATPTAGHITLTQTTFGPYDRSANQQDCDEPVLDGSTATGVCDAGAPWISYAVTLTDADAQATSHQAHLLLSDGNGNSADLVLGDLVDNGDGTYTLMGKKLWPGATVDGNGNATGWPGWELVNGVWQGPSSVNEGWVRGAITAVLSVNPEVTVNLSYPDATPECDGPKEIEVLPTLTVTDPKCGVDGSLSTPTDGEGYTFVGWKDGKAPKGAGTYTAQYAVTNVGVVFPGGATTYEITKSIKPKLSGASCDTLAVTGVTGFVTTVTLGALLLLTGGAIVGTVIWRRRKAA